MGATVLTGKAAAAMRVPGSDCILYALFEKTYEKNCYPHTDHWSCISFGSYEEVLGRIFKHASVCEGGMLQSRNGCILPENYIRDWQRHLRSPVLLTDKRVTLDREMFTDQSSDSVRAILDRFAVEHTALLVGGYLAFDLYQCAEIVHALFGEIGPCGPLYRVFEFSGIGSVQRPELGFTSSNQDYEAPNYQVWRLHEREEGVLIGYDNAPVRYAGWTYDAVGRFIVNEAYPRELSKTGASKDLIRQFREACKLAPLVPMETRLVVNANTELPLDTWYLDSFRRLTSKLGYPEGTTHFQCTFGDVCAVDEHDRDANAVYTLKHLRTDMFTWDIPDDGKHDVRPDLIIPNRQQPDLFSVSC